MTPGLSAARKLSLPCHSDADIDDHSIFFVRAFTHTAAFLLVILEISESPLLLLHKRIIRFSLTRTLGGNKIMPRFRSLRRDSRFVVRTQFL